MGFHAKNGSHTIELVVSEVEILHSIFERIPYSCTASTYFPHSRIRRTMGWWRCLEHGSICSLLGIQQALDLRNKECLASHIRSHA